MNNTDNRKGFLKEDLVIKANNIIGNMEDAQALINAIIPSDDKLGDIENFINRFKCKLFIDELEAISIGRLDGKELEKVRLSSEYILSKLIDYTKMIRNKNENFDSISIDERVEGLLKKAVINNSNEKKE